VQASGAKENRSMTNKISYTNEPLGEIDVIKDFLAPSSELAFREERIKVTLALSKTCVDFSKLEASKHQTQHQQRFLLRFINHRVHPIAQQIHDVQIAAYTQEAGLIGVTRFPPLERTVADLLQAQEEFLGAFDDERLVGALSFCPDGEGRGVNIASLTVQPKHQRLGVGHALVQAATELHGLSEMTVQTAAANSPALALYAKFGFEAYRHSSVGSEALAVVKLRREAMAVQHEAWG
jgi:ribosomal protein S18 acetylase RimI-like enzyme